MAQKVLLNSKVNIILHRACQLIENTSILKTLFSWDSAKRNFSCRAIILENEYNTPEIKLGYLELLSLEMICRRTDKPEG
jgi:pyrimidine operon attenuation protein/uracil phosphoribosyltransferase